MARSTLAAMSGDQEVDISRSLFPDDGLDSDVDSEEHESSQHGLLDFMSLGAGEKEPQEETDEDADEAFIAAAQAAVNRKTTERRAGKKAGAFQTMGLPAYLLQAIGRKGFTTPTPIQRKTMPLILDGHDVVGMARTGSGKTAAFVIPMIATLKAHSARVGARAVVLSPSRELALQTMKVVRELAKGTDLRTTLLVGGDSLEEQFGHMASNPDVIIATPGRFEHLKVEMGLQLSAVQYVVFDEADRLFEMGFAAQLHEILHSLPTSRQTLLFSATLPKSLVEFARAGLQDPKLVRLDAESKISPALECAFFTVKRAEKEGALLHILQDVIKMPTGPTDASLKAKSQPDSASGKKRKRGVDDRTATETPSPHSTVVFAATKHHVEYLAALLQAHNYATSYVYGALDQTARKLQVQAFRAGRTNILVVTDVAARGLDIPILANVINYDFPTQPKIFVHRVGRTARAGRAGWAYSFLTSSDIPYLLDLQLFLGRRLVFGKAEEPEGGGLFQKAMVVGGMVRDALERCVEEVGKLLTDNEDLASMRDVAGKGEKQYTRTRNAASAESVKRAKQIAEDGVLIGTNMLFEGNYGNGEAERARLDMLARVSGFRPQETVFEIGRRGGTNTETADVIRKRRGRIEAKQRQKAVREQEGRLIDSAHSSARQAPEDHRAKNLTDSANAASDDNDDDDLVLTQPHGADMDEASVSELEITFTTPAAFNDLTSASAHRRRRHGGQTFWKDAENFMSYAPSTLNVAEDRGYGVHSGTTHHHVSQQQQHFVSAAQDASMDLGGDDEGRAASASKSWGAGGMRWDKKGKKYVSRANDLDGSREGATRYIQGEGGRKIAASFRSGRFEAWKRANRVERLPRVGEMEKGMFQPPQHSGGGRMEGRRFKHKLDFAPKPADKYRDDFHKRKARVEAARERRVGRFAEGKGKSEVRGVEEVRKARKAKERRMEKNGRVSKKKG